jgi:uncharacterized protein YndB with AHSA1/START domain
MSKAEFIYTTYIKTTPEKLWDALTNAEFMKQYWFGMYCTSEWTAGSPWQLRFSDGQIGDAGEIVESVPPARLAIKWRNEWKPEFKAEGFSLCVFEIEPVGEAVRLTVTHGMDQSPSKTIEAVSGGWPKILSNLKSLLETGQVALSRTVDGRGKAA